MTLGCGGSGSPDREVPASVAPGTGDTKPCNDPTAFHVRFETSKGDFVVEVHPDWAPRGAARFRELVEAGFYDGCRFFRVVPGFVVQFGINGDPKVQAQWRSKTLKDDPVKQSNLRGYVSFASAGPNTRTTQVFINLVDNPQLDLWGFAPIGHVVSGMSVVDSIESRYREAPQQARIEAEGNAYLKAQFPKLDYVVHAAIVEWPAATKTENASDRSSGTGAASSSAALETSDTSRDGSDQASSQDQGQSAQK